MGVFRKSYTVAMPRDAIRVDVDGVPSVRYSKGGKPTIAPLTAKGDRILLETAMWYGWIDGEAVPLSSNKEVAERMLAEKQRQSDRRKLGIVDRDEEALLDPIRTHLADWKQSLELGGAKAKYIRLNLARVQAILEGCKVETLAQITSPKTVDAIEVFLASMRKENEVPTLPRGKAEWTGPELAELLNVKQSAIGAFIRRHRLQAMGRGKARRYPRSTVEIIVSRQGQGKSIQTSNHYLQAIRQFCRWLVQKRRLSYNPLEGIRRGNVRLDRRHDRHTLTEEQAKRLLETTGKSTWTFRGLSGRDRRVLYLLALSTGFRAEELAMLTPRAFDLDGDYPTVTIPARNTKSKSRAVQPIPLFTASELMDYLDHDKPGEPVWPGSWFERAAEMIRVDLEAAGITHLVDGPDGPLFLDMHALRHTFISLLDRPDVSMKQAMQLARHTDPRLTMARYGKARLHDLSNVVKGIPDLRSSGKDSEQMARKSGNSQ